MNSFLHSVIKNKCPNCLKGNFFIINNPYNLRKFDEMNKRCPVCETDFRQGPGFYLGAAITSYALQVVVVFTTYFFLQVIIEIKFFYFVGVVALLLILLIPVTFRISRLLWINMLGTKPKK